MIAGRMRHRLRQIAALVAASMAAGALYAWGTGGVPVEGMLTGLLISLPLLVFEIWIMRGAPGAPLRRLPFAIALAARILVYLAVIVPVLAGRLGAILAGNAAWGETRLDDVFFNSVLFSFAISLGANFLMLVNRLLGPRVLASFVTGRYFRPHEEERFFLFVDLEGSTALAERLGDLRFHEFLDRFFHALTGPILDHDGEIYRYVGDEAILTWRREPGRQTALPLACYLAIAERIGADAAAWTTAFDVVPRFRASLHCGRVVAGEIGDVKQEIVYLGDAVNTTARMEQACRDLGQRLVISDAALDGLVLPAEHRAVPLGATQLRGKRAEIALFALARDGG